MFCVALFILVTDEDEEIHTYTVIMYSHNGFADINGTFYFSDKSFGCKRYDILHFSYRGSMDTADGGILWIDSRKVVNYTVIRTNESIEYEMLEKDIVNIAKNMSINKLAFDFSDAIDEYGTSKHTVIIKKVDLDERLPKKYSQMKNITLKVAKKYSLGKNLAWGVVFNKPKELPKKYFWVHIGWKENGEMKWIRDAHDIPLCSTYYIKMEVHGCKNTVFYDGQIYNFNIELELYDTYNLWGKRPICVIKIPVMVTT